MKKYFFFLFCKLHNVQFIFYKPKDNENFNIYGVAEENY